MISQLTQEQWNILDGMRSNLGLAADLAQAKISLILPLDRSRQLCSYPTTSSDRQNAKAGSDICFLSVFDQRIQISQRYFNNRFSHRIISVAHHFPP